MNRGRIPQQERFSPTLLDRLVDSHPDVTQEPVKLSGHNLADYIHAIQRDLQNLLNTRQHFREDLLADYDDARRSIMVYGLPELNPVNRVTTNTQKLLSAAIENAIRLFEPRLVMVRVQPLPSSEHGVVHFRVEALARAEPAPERVVFDTTLDLERQTCRIEGEL